MELAKAYEPGKYEQDIYKRWEDSGLFNPDVCVEKGVTKPDADPFSIVLPPPNVTGTLHMGHAAMLAIEDVMVRYHRMKGDRTLWVPGTDHAAIATQSKVEKMIFEQEKKTRHDLGRDAFLERVKKFAQDSHDTIVNQSKRMGSSLDWSREAYTLDEKRNLAVRTVFKKMYDDGLIYRGSRIVNWDPKMQTTVSDDEIEYREQVSPFYYFQYGPFVIGTVRPETKFGDKYVVMHPDDERYKKYKHGDTLEVEWINGPIKATIIKDEAADPNFGSGVMTITTSHSVVDFEIAQRHGLDKEQVIDWNGNLLPIAGEFAGMGILEARKKIVEKLEKKGLLVKVDEKYVHNVALNSRGGGLIEPQIKVQWFVDVNKQIPSRGKSLKELMLDAVRKDGIQILPERFEKIYFHWIENLRDWNISRQIWFGHQIPVWYRRQLGGPHQAIHFNEEKLLEKIGMTQVEFRMKVQEWQKLPKLPDYAIAGGSSNIQIGPTLLLELKDRGFIDDKWIEANQIKQAKYLEEEIYCNIVPPEGDGWVQDPDTLDTWFSSGLWTFSALGWPNQEEWEKNKVFHPTAVLETGYDIIFFWVARMILMTTYTLGEVPFKTVYLHGLVRDEQGRKMSKSLDNIIDPLEMCDKYGTDATRLSLLIGGGPGNDMKLSEEKIGGFRNFANKLWNIARFMLLNIEKPVVNIQMPEAKTLADKWILSCLSDYALEVTENIEKYNFSYAGEELRDFTWGDLADWYLEIAKVEGGKSDILNYVLNTLLKLWHPYMPFVTETIWKEIYGKDAMLMVEKWPALNINNDIESVKFEAIRAIITGIRSLRSENKIEPAKLLSAYIKANSGMELLKEYSEVIKRLARLENLTIGHDAEKPKTAVGFVEGGIEVYVDLGGVIDVAKEKERLEKEIADLEKYVKAQEGKLGNQDFIARAPATVVEGEKKKLDNAKEKRSKLVEQLKSLT